MQNEIGEWLETVATCKMLIRSARSSWYRRCLPFPSYVQHCTRTRRIKWSGSTKNAGTLITFLISYERSGHYIVACKVTASSFGSRYAGRSVWLPKNSNESRARMSQEQSSALEATKDESAQSRSIFWVVRIESGVSDAITAAACLCTRRCRAVEHRPKDASTDGISSLRMNYCSFATSWCHVDGKSKTFGSRFGQSATGHVYPAASRGLCCWIDEVGKSPNRGFRTISIP